MGLGRYLRSAWAALPVRARATRIVRDSAPHSGAYPAR